MSASSAGKCAAPSSCCERREALGQLGNPGRELAPVDVRIKPSAEWTGPGSDTLLELTLCLEPPQCVKSALSIPVRPSKLGDKIEAGRHPTFEARTLAMHDTEKPSLSLWVGT